MSWRPTWRRTNENLIMVDKVRGGKFGIGKDASNSLSCFGVFVYCVLDRRRGAAVLGDFQSAIGKWKEIVGMASATGK